MASDWRAGEVRLFGLRHRYALPIVFLLLAGMVALLASGAYVVALAVAGAFIPFVMLFSSPRGHMGIAPMSPLLWTEVLYRQHARRRGERAPPPRDNPPEPPSPDHLP